MNRPVLKLSYNAPVTLTFALLSFLALVLGHFTNGWTTTHLFSVYRCALSDPMAFSASSATCWATPTSATS